MSLDPKVVEMLMKEVPEMKQFRDFLFGEVKNLNNLSALKEVPNVDLMLEVRARERAIDVLFEILSPLINRQQVSQRNSASDYVV